MKRVLTRARELFAALKRRPRLLRTLEVIAGVVVVGLCTWSVSGEWSKAWPELRHARPGYVALALGTVSIYYLVFILGWIRILAAWGMNVPYIPALQSEMVSMLAKYVPGGVWTPAARVAALSKLTGETAIGTILASILVEAVLSAISGVVVFVVSLAWVHDVDAPIEPLLFFAVLCLLVLHPAIFGPLMRRLTRPFGLAPIEPLPFSLMGRLLVFYCGTWLIGGLALFFLIRSVGGSPALSTIPFLGGTAAIGAIVAVLVVFAPSGLGVREASMYGLLTAVTTSSAALGVTILNRLAITLVELALFSIGIAMWRLRQRRAARLEPYVGDPEGSTSR
jgi:glycosyltransferase 2 family protein